MTARPPTIPATLNVDTINVNKILKIVNETVGNGLSKITSWKSSVVAATFENLVNLRGLDILDEEVLLHAGDRVLVKDQTNMTMNGIYIASETDWARAPDLPVGTNASGIIVFVVAYGENPSSTWVCVNSFDDAKVGEANLDFHLYAPGEPEAGGITGSVQYKAAEGGGFVGNEDFLYEDDMVKSNDFVVRDGLYTTSTSTGVAGTVILVGGLGEIFYTGIKAEDKVFLQPVEFAGTPQGVKYLVEYIVDDEVFEISACDDAGLLVATDVSTLNYFVVRIENPPA